MEDKSLSMIISSCDAFSDLWDGHVKQLERYWGDRKVECTLLLTDKPTEKTYDNVRVVAAGENVEWSQRLKMALETIQTEYVLITLDDYFLIHKVDNRRIAELLGIMKEYSLDYLRLFQRPKRATCEQLGDHKGVHKVDTSVSYCVNMYTGIWRTDFAKYCSDCDMTAWAFEVALPKMARDYNACCAVDNQNDFVILDVVRKGKLLHRSARFFEKNPDLYSGSREVNTWGYEFRLWVRTMFGRHTPMWLHKRLKMIMRSFGKEFFTEE